MSTLTFEENKLDTATEFFGRLVLHPVQTVGTLPDTPFNVGEWGAKVVPMYGGEAVATVTEAWRSQILPGFFGIRYRAVTPDGARWHGRANDSGEMTRMIRCK